MRAIWWALGLIAIGLPGVDAQDRKFPYAAVCDVDEEDVRCGPGPKYYATSKLRRGEKVVVHRHDPGGWAMVAPPEGSFSLVQTEYIQKNASGKGSLTSNNVIAHVGSSLGDDRGVYQRMLSRGDTVEILGEQTFISERGPVAMYRIKPPAREYRWVAGKSLVPADSTSVPAPAGTKKSPVNQPVPFIQGPIAQDLETEVAVESDVFESTPVSQTDTPAFDDPLSKTASLDDPRLPVTPVTSSTSPLESDSLEALRQQLSDLDQQFRQTLMNEPKLWNLAELKTAYTALEQKAQHPAFTSHVQQRLATLQRYAKLQADYVEFDQLTTATQQRDVQLLTLQRQNDAQLQQQMQQMEAAAPQVQPVSSSGTVPFSPNPAQRPSPVAAPVPSGNPPLNAFPPSMEQGNLLPSPPGTTAIPTNFTGDTGPSLSTPPQMLSGMPTEARPATGPAPTKKFSGAGIVQRSSIPAPGVPPYMLVAPDGRLLAYLEAAPGIDLAGAQNQSLGIIGERGFRDELKTDVIVVRGYQPVMLRTTQR